MQLIKYCFCCSLIEQINGKLHLKEIFIALNPRRNKNIFCAEFFDNRALMIAVLRKTKNVQNIFTRKGKYYNIKKKRKSLLFCFYIILFVPCVLFMSRNSNQLYRCNRRNVWKLSTFSFWKLTHLLRAFSVKSLQCIHDKYSW